MKDIETIDKINAVKNSLFGASSLLYALADQPSDINPYAVAEIASLIERAANGLDNLEGQR